MERQRNRLADNNQAQLSTNWIANSCSSIEKLDNRAGDMRR